MKRAGIPVMALAIVALLLSACGGRREAPREASDQIEISDLTSDALEWADSMLRAMTLREKVAQMFMPAIYASADSYTLARAREYADSCLGGIILLKGDSAGAAALAAGMQQGKGIGAFVAVDAEWGLAMRLTDAPAFPLNSDISKSAGDQLMYDYGRELARECRLLGINMILGPVVDVNAPDGFMRRRSFGDDPVRVADLAIAYARGLEDGDVMSVAKHFPGHGSVTSDSHKRKGVIERSLNEMDSVDLYPFRKWIEQRLSGIMVGHLAVPSIDPEMRPAAVSHTVITDLLRRDLGFSGLILTDALNMGGAGGYGAVDAVLAGADIMVAPARTFESVESVVKAVGEGKIPETRIDDSVRRILFQKYLLGLDGSRHPDRGRLSIPETDSISARLAK